MAPDIPPEAELVGDLLIEHLAGDLEALYLYGSATLGRLRPSSDVDLLAIVNGRINAAQRQGLLGAVMALSSQPGHDGRRYRPIELTVFRLSDLTAPARPPLCAFMYGEWMRPDCEAGYVPTPFASFDFNILFGQALKSSIALYGPPADTLLPSVPSATLRDAVLHSVDDVLNHLHGDERNVLLTLARMWHTLETGDIVPKDVAASWASKRLSQSAARMLTHARDAYLGRVHDDWSGRDDDAFAAASEIASHLSTRQHRSRR